MDWVTLLGLGLVIGLVIYLSTALLVPEKFS